MNNSILIFCVFVTGLGSALSGQVQRPEAREETLDGMHEVLARKECPTGDFADLESPFYSDAKPAVEIEEKPEEEPVEEEAVNQVLPEAMGDAAALAIIARRFKPLGSMVLGERGYLQLPKGRTIEKGQSFRAEIRGFVYEAFVQDVTERSYTLQLGEARLNQSFMKTGLQP